LRQYLALYPLLILFWGSHDTNLKVAIITCWTFISKMIIWVSLCNRTAKEEDTKTFVCDKCDQAITYCLNEGEFMFVTQGFAVRFPLHPYCASSLLQNNTIIKTLSSSNTTIWKTQLGCIISGKFINFMYTKILKPAFMVV